MGFDVNRFKSPALLEVIPRIFCMFCEKVLQEPMSLSTCGHIFCKECIRGSIFKERMCPEDRVAFGLKDIQEGPKFLEQILGDFEIGCDFASLGCQQFIYLKHLSDHNRDCPFNPDARVLCEDNCGALLKREDVASHSCAPHLLRIVRDNKRLLEIIMKKSPQIRRGIKEIADIEGHVNEKLQKIILNLEEDMAVEQGVSGGHRDVYLTDGHRKDSAKETESNKKPASDGDQQVIKEPRDGNEANERKEVILLMDDEEEGEEGDNGICHNENKKSLQAKDGEEEEDDTHGDNDCDSTHFSGNHVNGKTTNTHSTTRPLALIAPKRGPSGLRPSLDKLRYSTESHLTTSSGHFTRSTGRGDQGISSEEMGSDETSYVNEERAEADEIVTRNGSQSNGSLAKSTPGQPYSMKKLELPCKSCDKVFSRKSYLMVHSPCYFTERGIKGKKKMTFRCEVCNKMVKKLDKLKSHMASHVDTDIYRCNYCGKEFAFKGNVNQHMRLHTGDRPYQCRVCKRSFAQNSNLKAHVHTCKGGDTSAPKPSVGYKRKSTDGEMNGSGHQMSAAFPPEVISETNLMSLNTETQGLTNGNRDEVQMKSEALRSGVSVVNRAKDPTDSTETSGDGLKLAEEGGSRGWFKRVLSSKGREVTMLMKRLEFPCDSCKVTFNRKSLQMAHQPCYSALTDVSGVGMEGNELPYECQFCPKKFSQLLYLRNHITIHVDQDIYKCISCEKLFCREHDAIRHNRVHSGDRPYRCPFCSRAFAQSNNLKDHVMIHTGEKAFKCVWPGCQMKFAVKKAFRDHMKRHRNERPFKCLAPGCQFRFISGYERKRHSLKRHSNIRIFGNKKMPV